MHTPGSPNSQNIYGSGRFVNNGGAASGISLYGNLSDDFGTQLDVGDGDQTLKAQQQQQQHKSLLSATATGSTSVRHQIKTSSGGGSRQDDSANYSLTSSNESAENTRSSGQANRIIASAEYATSVV